MIVCLFRKKRPCNNLDTNIFSIRGSVHDRHRYIVEQLLTASIKLFFNKFRVATDIMPIVGVQWYCCIVILVNRDDDQFQSSI